MIKNIQSMINNVVDREKIYMLNPVCRCGNKDLFHFSGYVFECDNCDIVIIVKRK